MERLLVRARERARQHPLQGAVADHRRGVGQRSVLPSIAADIDELAEVVEQLADGLLLQSSGMRADCVVVNCSFELLDPPGEEQVLPGRPRRDHRELRCLPNAIRRADAGSPTSLRRRRTG